MLKLWWIMEKRKVKNFFIGLLITLIVVGGAFLNTKLIFVPIEKGAELPKSYICGFLLTLYEVIILYIIYLAISLLIENIIKKKIMRKKKNFFTGLLITLIVVGGVFLNTKLIYLTIMPAGKGIDLPISYIYGILLTIFEVIMLYSIFSVFSSLIENIKKKKRMRKKIFCLLNIDTKNYECEKYVSELIETFGLKDRFCLYDIPKELGVLFKEKLSNYNLEEILKVIKVVEKSEDDLDPDTIVNNFNKFFDTNFERHRLAIPLALADG